MDNTETALQRVMKFFKIGINKDYKNVTIQDKIRPLEKDKEGKLKPVDFPPFVEKLYNLWLNCRTDLQRYEGMIQVWQDMDLIYFNNVLIKRSIDLMTDETIQADLNPEYIEIEASPKVKDFILNFFDKITLYSKLRSTIEDLIQYGNTGWILSESENGVEEIIQPDIYDFKDILQFAPYEIDKLLKKKDKFFTEYSAKERMDKLLKSILDKNNYSSYFKKYVIGYQIGDYVMPPWKFIHFKNATSKSPFDPFGIPFFIHSVSAYKQYDAAMTMQMILRGANIPVEKYEINAPNVVDPVSKINLVTSLIRNIQNSGFSTTRKEEKGVGETIFTIKDLYNYEIETPNLDIGKIDDLEMLFDELVISTGLPRHLIDPHDSGFGESGISLIQQFKPFARQIYRIQSIVLENISQLIKIEMILSGNFSEDEMDFVLSMPFPESQVNSEIITSQESLLDLVDKTISLLSDTFLHGEPLPNELMYAIFSDILPYNQDTINKWMTYIKQEQQSGDLNDSIYVEARKRFNERADKLKIKELILNQKVKYLKEGVSRNKHYFSSINKNPVFEAEKLNEWSIEDVSQLLKEEIEKKDEKVYTN